MLLSSSLVKELVGGMLVSEEANPVDTVLDSSTEEEVDATSLSCEVLESDSGPAEELNNSPVDVGPSVLPWLLGVDISAVLVETSEPVGVDVASLLLLASELITELSLALSRLLDGDPVKEEEASGLLVGGSVDVPAEDSELSNELG